MKLRKIVATLLASALLVTGCTSVTKTGALGIDRQQLMLVSYEKMDKISAEAYVKALKEARDKGKLNIDPILTKRVRDIANRLLAIATAAGLGSVGITALGIATQFSIQMPFSRQHETEADRIGTELMARAGYDPKEAVEVWVKMNNTNVGKIPEILSTHPSNESRVKDLREIAVKLEPIYLASKNNTLIKEKQ